MSKTNLRSGYGVIRLGNALYYGLQTKKSQSFRDFKIMPVKILGRNKYDSSTLARHPLHWLPVEERI